MIEISKMYAIKEKKSDGYYQGRLYMRQLNAGPGDFRASLENIKPVLHKKLQLVSIVLQRRIFVICIPSRGHLWIFTKKTSLKFRQHWFAMTRFDRAFWASFEFQYKFFIASSINRLRIFPSTGPFALFILRSWNPSKYIIHMTACTYHKIWGHTGSQKIETS